MSFTLLGRIVKDRMLAISLNKSPNIHMAEGHVDYSKGTALQPPTHGHSRYLFFGKSERRFQCDRDREAREKAEFIPFRLLWRERIDTVTHTLKSQEERNFLAQPVNT